MSVGKYKWNCHCTQVIKMCLECVGPATAATQPSASKLSYLKVYILFLKCTPFNYWLISCSRVLLETLTVARMVKKPLVFYGTRNFPRVITAVCPEPVYWNLYSHSLHFKVHFNIILLSTHKSLKCSLNFTSFDFKFVRFSHLLYACYMSSHLSVELISL